MCTLPRPALPALASMQVFVWAESGTVSSYGWAGELGVPARSQLYLLCVSCLRWYPCKPFVSASIELYPVLGLGWKWISVGRAGVGGTRVVFFCFLRVPSKYMAIIVWGLLAFLSVLCGMQAVVRNGTSSEAVLGWNLWSAPLHNSDTVEILLISGFVNQNLFQWIIFSLEFPIENIIISWSWISLFCSVTWRRTV